MNRLEIQSKIGGRSENQDFYGKSQTNQGQLIVVCDGMGGHKGGRHAAEVAVNTVLEEFLSNVVNKKSANFIKQAIERANTKIWEESNSNTLYNGMGTTIAVLLLMKDSAISCHVGDSRMYQIRNGQILFRTFDHSHVFEMVSAGLLTEEQARLSDKSNLITRALGISPTVEIDVTDNLHYQQGDRFLLCTDGIWGELPEKELIKLASKEGNVRQIVEELVEKIDAIGFKNGGKHDNLTAALIEIDKEIDARSEVVPYKKRKSFFKVITKFLRKK